MSHARIKTVFLHFSNYLPLSICLITAAVGKLGFRGISTFFFFFFFFFSFFFLGGGGQVAARYEHESPHIFYTQHIATISSTELYSLMKIFLIVFKIEGIVA